MYVQSEISRGAGAPVEPVLLTPLLESIIIDFLQCKVTVLLEYIYINFKSINYCGHHA